MNVGLQARLLVPVFFEAFWSPIFAALRACTKQECTAQLQLLMLGLQVNKSEC